MERETIRARSIELVGERGEVSLTLDGGGGDREPGIIVYVPRGPESAVTIHVRRDAGRPYIMANTAAGSAVVLTSDQNGIPRFTCGTRMASTGPSASRRYSPNVLVGSAADADRAVDADAVLESLANSVAFGTTALGAELEEATEEVVDGEKKVLGHTAFRGRGRGRDSPAAEEEARRARSESRKARGARRGSSRSRPK